MCSAHLWMVFWLRREVSVREKATEWDKKGSAKPVGEDGKVWQKGEDPSSSYRILTWGMGFLFQYSFSCSRKRESS